MSFNKIGNGYYNSDLCKCLLAIGGAYFVELKNGVKVNISKDDYDAMADGLLSVNGVKYCDPTLVASAKHIGAKYIVEFSNGNQFSISQSDYEGLIAAGFVAIGDIYYNPDDIDKVYAVAGGYFAEMVNGQKVVMTEEEYDAIVGEEPGPTPGALIPLSNALSVTTLGIDPTALTDDQMNTACQAIYTGSTQMCGNIGDYMIMVGNNDVSLYCQLVNETTGDMINWCNADWKLDPSGPVIMPKGWSRGQAAEEIVPFTPFSTLTNITVNGTVSDLIQSFAESVINGAAIGKVD